MTNNTTTTQPEFYKSQDELTGKIYYNYQDAIGNPIYPYFRLGGFNNDILCCDLRIKRWKNKEGFLNKLLTFLGFKRRFMEYKTIYQAVTLDKPDRVSKYKDKDYHKFVVCTIQDYINRKEADEQKLNNKRYIKNKIKELNTKEVI